MTTLRERLRIADTTGVWSDDLIDHLFMLADLLPTDIIPAVEHRLAGCPAGSDEYLEVWGGLVILEGIAESGPQSGGDQ